MDDAEQPIRRANARPAAARPRIPVRLSAEPLPPPLNGAVPVAPTPEQPAGGPSRTNRALRVRTHGKVGASRVPVDFTDDMRITEEIPVIGSDGLPAGSFGFAEPPVQEDLESIEDEALDLWTPTAGTATAIDGKLAAYLDTLVDSYGSDLHLTAGQPPTARIDGLLSPIVDEEALHPASIERMLRSTMNDERWTRFQRDRQLDYSIAIPSGARFRVNAYFQRSTVAGAFRMIPAQIPTLDELGVPDGLMRTMYLPYGLVLFVGPTGSGKSTTQAALIEQINQEAPCHILTIEDPIEYVHTSARAMINQREVGHDVVSFAAGLRAALREDPDVILLGEMRDDESVAITLTLAETGHLVYATLHTNDAAQAIDRIIDSYPANKREQVQAQLSSVLQAVVSQRLVRRVGGGRVAAFEVMIVNDAIRNLIREGKIRQIRNVVATGTQDGMQTLEMSLDRLVSSGVVLYDEAVGLAQYWREIRNPAVTAAAAAAAEPTNW
jgi:twitching motility protein PilT